MSQIITTDNGYAKTKAAALMGLKFYQLTVHLETWYHLLFPWRIQEDCPILKWYLPDGVQLQIRNRNIVHTSLYFFHWDVWIFSFLTLKHLKVLSLFEVTTVI